MSKSSILIVFVALLSSGALPASRGIMDIGHRHLTDLTAGITTADGSKRTVQLEGVGCTASVCSRTAIRGRDQSGALVDVWLDSIRTITAATPLEADFLLKDGTQRRITLLSDFRVLYLERRLGGPERIDLGMVKSVEFSAVK
jgi:hypothetical protein